MARAFGVDISKFQSSQDGTRKQDFNALKSHSEEVVFIAARAGISWGYKDPMFDYYWSEMARIQVCRLAYHVIYFGESALAQMDSLFKILGSQSDWEHDRIVLDLEEQELIPKRVSPLLRKNAWISVNPAQVDIPSVIRAHIGSTPIYR